MQWFVSNRAENCHWSVTHCAYFLIKTTCADRKDLTPSVHFIHGTSLYWLKRALHVKLKVHFWGMSTFECVSLNCEWIPECVWLMLLRKVVSPWTDTYCFFYLQTLYATKLKCSSQDSSKGICTVWHCSMMNGKCFVCKSSYFVTIATWGSCLAVHVKFKHKRQKTSPLKNRINNCPLFKMHS